MAGNFDFVRDTLLRSNINAAFDYILKLIPLSDSDLYEKDIQASFRKNIIIYTASIIEALLLYKIKVSVKEDDLIRRVSSVKVIKRLYDIDPNNTFIALVENQITSDKIDLEKLNLDQINKLAKEKSLIDKKLSDRVDRVRALRNKLHIGTLKILDATYNKQDLEYVFSVAKDIKKLF